MTGDPVAYLRARYADEETDVALGYPDGWHTVRCGHDQIEFSADCTCDLPAWRLLGIAAKRAILAEHGPEWQVDGWGPDRTACRTCRYDGGLNTYPTGRCPTVLALVRPYASRDDFDPSWGSE